MIQQLKNNFEKDLKNKLSLKSSSKLGIDQVLLKAFKFYDLQSTGKADKNQFLRAIAKTGVVFEDIQQANQIFLVYDQNNSGFIDYKEFVNNFLGISDTQSQISANQSVLHNNPQNVSHVFDHMQENQNNQFDNRSQISHQQSQISQQQRQYNQNQMQQYQNQNQYSPSQSVRSQQINNNQQQQQQYQQTPSQISQQSQFQRLDAFGKFRQILQTRGGTGLMKFHKNLMIQDTIGKQSINFNQFRKALRDFRLNLDYDMLETIFNQFDKSKTGQLNYQEFIEEIRGPLSKSRYETITQIFQAFDEQQQYIIDLKTLREQFDAKNHPLVQKNRKSPQEVLSEFSSNLDLYTDLKNIRDGKLALQDFLDFSSYLSFSFEFDNDFIEFYNGVWNPKQIYSSSQQQQFQNQQQNLNQQFQKNLNFNDQQSQRPQQQMNNFMGHQNEQNQNFDQKSVSQQSNVNSQQNFQNYKQEQQQLQQQEQQQYQFSPNPYGKKTNFTSEQDPIQATRPLQNQSQNFQKQTSQFTQNRNSGQKASQKDSQYNLLTGEENKYSSPGQLEKQRKNQFQPSFDEISQNNSQISYQSKHSQQINKYKANPFENVSTRQIELILQRIHKRLCSRGVRGFLGLQKQFAIIDSDNDGLINLEQFKQALQRFRVDVTESEIEIVFNLFDKQLSKYINYRFFLYTLRGELDGFRTIVVQTVFDKIDTDRDGEVTLTECFQNFSARNHPEVKNNRKSEEEVNQEFRESLILHHQLEGNSQYEIITKHQFFQYFSYLSSTIQDNSYFESIMRQAFKISNETNLFQQHAGHKQYFDQRSKAYLQDHHKVAVFGGNVAEHAPFGTDDQVRRKQLANQQQVKYNDFNDNQSNIRSEISKPTQSQQFERATPIRRPDQLDIFGGYQNEPQNNKKTNQDFDQKSQISQQPSYQQSQQYNQNFHDNQSQQYQESQQNQQMQQNPMQQQNNFFHQQQLQQNQHEPEQQSHQAQNQKQQQQQFQEKQSYSPQQERQLDQNIPQIQKLKEKLIQRGVKGFLSLLRQFKLGDVQLSGQLNFQAFLQCLKDLRIELTEQQIQELFHQNANQEGFLLYEPFFEQLIGNLSGQRKYLVTQAFSNIDYEHSGEISLDELKNSFQARGHPEVKARRATEQEIMVAFLDNIDFFYHLCVPMDVQKSNLFAIFDFIEYYRIVSACVVDDGFFEQMIMGCWKLENFQQGFINSQQQQLQQQY
ncbi:hypothetical protein PPERSA_07062 [Pseudocohnilembus persalinus]|uniref:EF-hand domain-containing protein n=1 Tax=Pseudocohnilembus persalinus TaxID=266149 RepID=A0A0V0QAW7_PSEPJ|nr:hypothetical protein PPERSA_07062 [Pseudocohnilembus persalinus]|eukprot:KRW99290.1 hypothetical protein PPERSA_07062 [Pseudocohnilembus persalinus]